MIQTKKQQHENKIKYTVFNQRKQHENKIKYTVFNQRKQHENKIKYTVFNQRKQIPLSTVKRFEKSFKVSYFYNFMNLGIEEQLYIYYL